MNRENKRHISKTEKTIYKLTKPCYGTVDCIQSREFLTCPIAIECCMELLQRVNPEMTKKRREKEARKAVKKLKEILSLSRSQDQDPSAGG